MWTGQEVQTQASLLQRDRSEQREGQKLHFYQDEDILNGWLVILIVSCLTIGILH
jgi:hypothetical protein